MNWGALILMLYLAVSFIGFTIYLNYLIKQSDKEIEKQEKGGN